MFFQTRGGQAPSIASTRLRQCCYVWTHRRHSFLSVDLEGDCIIEEKPRTETTLLGSSSAEILDEPRMVMSAEPFNAPAYLNLEVGSLSPTVHVKLTNFDENLANLAEDKNQLPSDASQLRTGRLTTELKPHPKGFTEYMEVKTTVSSRKYWFDVSPREWQFASEKGDLFSIACVILGTKKASIEMLKKTHTQALQAESIAAWSPDIQIISSATTKTKMSVLLRLAPMIFLQIVMIL